MKIKKFCLLPLPFDDKYEKFIVIDLKEIYYTNNGKKDNIIFSGAVCLVKNPDYPGYCTLCCVHHEPNFSSQFNHGYKIEFAPLYTKNGEMILINYNHDSMFCVIDGHPVKNKDCILTLWKNGTIDWFNKNLTNNEQ